MTILPYRADTIRLMQIMSVSDSATIKLVCEALSRGELVIYPTETCYGIAVDATNSEAVTKLLAYKGDRHRQVAIAVANQEMAEKYVEINEIAGNLYTHFLPGPITVISESKHTVDERLESATGGLGIRIPKHDFALELIKSFGKPITATSANTSGKKEPYSLSDWQTYTTKERQEVVSLFLDAGKLADRPTSTVVDTTLNDPQILRQGELIIPELSPSFTSNSANETLDIAKQIIAKHLPLTLRFPLILALQGELGVGKTQFVKGLASLLNITENVSSPTYTLMKEYPYAHGKYAGTLYHIDTWRLADQSELESTLHLNDILKAGNIVAIEWAGKAESVLKSYEKNVPILVINIKELDENSRQISYAFSTPEWS
jgi:L-threonylcarbamoyladenylate synthase